MDRSLFPEPGVPRVAVLVATCNRPEFLESRSLPSVLGQTHPPDILVVVDDSSPDGKRRNEAVVARIASQARFPMVRLDNSRTRGASGAWNTGLDHIRKWAGESTNTFVAILDDDDEWLPDHLARCVETVQAGDLDMTAALMHRLETNAGPVVLETPPLSLCIEDFLVGNPGIQGSNLFVRLGVLFAAGCFDEALPSTTDRDLCIRIADLGSVRYAPTSAVTVRHFAEASRGRLSTPGSRAKHVGLERFWRKYRGRMSPSLEAKFKDRAVRLFEWNPIDPMEDGISLVVGVVADAAKPEQVEPLLTDLVALGANAGVAGLDVIVLENGPRVSDGSRPLHELVDRVRGHGLRCFFIDIERQQEDAAAGRFGNRGSLRQGGRLGIAMSRTMVQAYAYALARRRPGAVVWILDDDKRLAPLLTPDPRNGHRNLVPALLRFRQAGVSVVLGVDEDSPPLPAAVALRVQVVDLLHNLEHMAGLEPDSLLPDREYENADARRRNPDYYYDLTCAGGAHLETPFWLRPEPGETVLAAFRRLAERLPRILAGEQVFRPLALDGERDPVNAAVPSVHRGGNTFVLDAEALTVPNLAVTGEEELTRRSDMIWSLLQRYRFGRRVEQAPLPVRHDRSRLSPTPVRPGEVAKDLRGHALYRSLEELLEARRKGPGSEGDDDLVFDADELDRAAEGYDRHLRHRLDALGTSFVRVQGLVPPIRRLLDPTSPRPWWHAAAPADVAKIREVVERLAIETLPERFAEIERAAWDVPAGAVRRFFESLPVALEQFRAATAHRDELYAELDRQRVEIARKLVTRLMPAACELRHLGTGAEGVVFTDGDKVYKSFDYWKTRAAARQREFLRGLVGRWKGTTGIYPIEALSERGIHAVMVYSFEPGEPYQGGHGAGLVRLLRECREYGIVCNNLTPDNLRVTAAGVRLIDYGVDIVPWSPEGFESMCRRAWLCWRWWFRPDLKDLMRRSLDHEDLPELAGIEMLRRALEIEDDADRLYQRIASIVGNQRLRRVLDYGCGKGKLASRLAAIGFDVVAWDPDPELRERWVGDGDGPRFGGQELLDAMLASGDRFDVVICSIVLCVLPDGPEYQAILKHLRSLVTDDGTVVVAVCNPWHTTGPATPWMDKKIPDHVALGETFTWTYLGSRGVSTPDTHRPVDRLRRDLLRAGLRIESTSEIATVDLERFEPSSDHLVLVLRPVAPGKHPISLAIKACVMEWETLDTQVRHLVDQLEGPRAFDERILVLDTRTAAFAREYARPDADAAEAVAARLLRDGVIDRVVRPPAADPDLRALNRSWFGTDSTATHAVNGGPTAAACTMFESAKGEFLLQVDADLMVFRQDHSVDYLAPMMDLFERDPGAVTASLSIATRMANPWTSSGPLGTPWRVEVRGSLIHRERVLAMRPFENRETDGRLDLPWHRAVDRSVQRGRGTSYRGGDPKCFFVHPQNERKQDRAGWMATLDRIEAGFVPPTQLGQVEWTGDLAEWLGPKRHEPFVFVVTGRNVLPGRFLRCLRSMADLYGPWGAVVIDDGSERGVSEFVRYACAPWSDRITVIRTRVRRGSLANTVWAIRYVIANPETVVVTLDADDALIGKGVITRLQEAYDAGADVTVGSMLRTDKIAPYPVQFRNPRSHRGGNVWQHLRSFRKRLFDAIPDDALRLDGAYVEIAPDWAYMIPIIEMAAHPVHLPEALYLYEPSGVGKGPDRDRRESEIARIVSRSSIDASQTGNGQGWETVRTGRAPATDHVLTSQELIERMVASPRHEGFLTLIRHAERPSLAGLARADRDAMALTPGGIAQARCFGEGLVDIEEILSSPIGRCVQTAESIASGLAGPLASIQVCEVLDQDFRLDGERYEALKASLGWKGTVLGWLEGSIPSGILVPHAVVARRVLSSLRDLRRDGSSRILAVTHDFLIIAMAASLFGIRTVHVPYLGGLILDWDTLEEFGRGGTP